MQKTIALVGLLALVGCGAAPKDFTPITKEGAACKVDCSPFRDHVGRNQRYNACIDACADLDRLTRR